MSVGAEDSAIGIGLVQGNAAVMCLEISGAPSTVTTLADDLRGNSVINKLMTESSVLSDGSSRAAETAANGPNPHSIDLDSGSKASAQKT